MQLPRFARAGRYLLRYLHAFKEVPRGAIFAQVFRPGSRLIMPLVVSYDDRHADICPGCQSPSNDSGEISTLQCKCGVVYTRSSRSQDRILMLLAHRKLLHQSTKPQPEGPTSQEVVQSKATKEPLIHQHRLPTDKPPRFEIVNNLKNVDFSAPRMILVLDLLGYMYMVPWRMVRSAEKMMFFLQRFVAGGSILVWSCDYVIVDDKDMELTAANWETSAYPGISIALHPRTLSGDAALRQTLMSRIQDLLSSSTRIYRDDIFGDALEQVCLLVGATSAQYEMRSLVKEVVAACFHKTTLTHHTSPSEGTRSGTKPLSICLICRHIYPTCLDLAKHTGCHLIALRCERACDICDEQKLPYFADEDVSRQQTDGQPSSMEGNSLVGDRNIRKPPHGALRGSWVCCRCRQTNSRGTCPTRCPIDGHYQCLACYVYR